MDYLNVKTSIVIPAYNEEKGIGTVLESMTCVVDKDYEIIVVDDGSKDKTYEIAKGFDIQILRHKKNLGKGAAMMTGVENTTKEYVVFIDADNTYPAENIPQIVENLDQGYDMGVGSRFIFPDQMTRLNRIGNKLLGLPLKFVYGSKTSDPFSGLYGIKRKHLLNMDIVSKGFEIEAEIAIKSARMDLNIVDIPIRYGERIGETKLNPIKDGYRIMTTLLNFSSIV